MPPIIRSMAAVVAGILTALIAVVAVELIGAVAHPVPGDFDASSKEQMHELVATLPTWLLVFTVPAWGFTAWLSTWVAQRIGGSRPALVVALLLVVAVIYNVALLPYPLWFKVLAAGAVIAAVFLVTRRHRELEEVSNENR